MSLAPEVRREGVGVEGDVRQQDHQPDPLSVRPRSVDWSREAFTMDANLFAAVTETFGKFHEVRPVTRSAPPTSSACHVLHVQGEGQREETVGHDASGDHAGRLDRRGAS